MRLSVCCLTNDSPAQVERALGCFRGIADEIVVGADSRVSAAHLSGYDSFADRVITCDFDFFEKHLAWLHERCRGEWVLRLDSDEVPSEELIELVPSLIADQRVVEYAFPRRWVSPDGTGWYDELPWAPDFQTRLVTRAGVTFAGVPHSNVNPRTPARFVDAPIYHAICALESYSRRQERVRYHDGLRPDLLAPGGGKFNATYYLPEDAARRAPLPIGTGDLARVSALLSAAQPEGGLAGRTPGGTSGVGERGGGAAHPAPTGTTAVQLIEKDLRFYPDETREVYAQATNGTEAAWPGGDTAEPLVRLSYRMRRADDSMPSEGPRSLLRAPLTPDETCITPIVIRAPEEPGTYELTIDLVHEGVRWLDVGETVQIRVMAETAQAAIEMSPRSRSSKRSTGGCE